jgi:hypothetical protein
MFQHSLESVFARLFAEAGKHGDVASHHGLEAGADASED